MHGVVAPVLQWYVAPGRAGAQSCALAPGQVKKQHDAQSAREFAPGHVKKQQVAQSTQSTQSTQTLAAPAPTPDAHPLG